MRVLPGEEMKTVIHYLLIYVKSYAIVLHGNPIGRKPTILENFQAYTGFSFSYLQVKLLTHD